MKAIIWTRYGSPDVLQLRDVEKPAPGDKEVLIKVHAATVTAGDCEARMLRFPFMIRLPLRLYIGVRKPTRINILGQELAGEVEAVGREVTRFKQGDPVFAATYFRFGAYAQYACLPETSPILKPANMTYAEAATLPTGGVNGLHFLRVANIQPGEKVLINGAGGSIGTYAVQIAKAFGAEVTAVDRGEKLSMLRSIGADRVIDYTREDFTRNGQTYDVIVDIVSKSPFARSLKSLKKQGRYILGNATLSATLRSYWASATSEKKAMVALAEYKAEDYAFLKELVESGKVRAVIDRHYPLEQTAEAHRYVESGQKQGNVIITVDHDQGM